MAAALVTVVLVLLLSCSVVPGVSLHETKEGNIAAAIAASLHTNSHGTASPTSAAAGPGAVGSRSPAQTAGDSTPDPASSGHGSRLQTDAESYLNTLIQKLGPAASLADHESPSPHPELTGTDRHSTEADRELTGNNTSSANITAPLPQFGRYWQALNAFLGDSDLGQPGTVDAALEQLFGQNDSDHHSIKTRGGASTARSARSRGSTATEKQHSATAEKAKRLPKLPSSPLKLDEAADEGAPSHAASAAEDGKTTTPSPGKHNAPNESKNSTAPSPSTSVEQVSSSVTNSPAEQQKEHRGQTGSAWSRRNRPGRPFSALGLRLSGVLNNGTISRMLAGHWAAAASNSSSHRGRVAVSIRALGRLLASHRAAAASSNGSNSNSSSNSSTINSGSRGAFSFRTLGRLLASHRAATSASRGSSSSSGDEPSSALNDTSNSTGHRLHSNSADSVTNMATDGETNRNNSRPPGRRPGWLLHRVADRLGSHTAAANDSRRTPGRKGDPQTDAWTSSASSLLVGLLTPGRMADTVSEAVGRASSRLTDRLLDRLTRPLQTITGRASSRLSRLPKLLAPAQKLVMGDLVDPVRPQQTAFLHRGPRSEMERLQRRLSYSESAERATAAELGRLRRRLSDRRLASRAHWSVTAAERNGDMMAHLWTLQP